LIETELLRHGYLFVFLGTIFEEDATLLTAAFLAHRGYLRFSWVLIIAALSTIVANQTYFLIARRTGIRWLNTTRAGRPKAETIISWSQKHGALLIVASRFMPGVRTLITVVSSVTGMEAPRFLVWNAVGAFCWTMTVGFAGYLGGHAFTIILHDIGGHEKIVAAALAIGSAGLILWKTRGRDLLDLWSLRRAIARDGQ